MVRSPCAAEPAAWWLQALQPMTPAMADEPGPAAFPPSDPALELLACKRFRWRPPAANRSGATPCRTAGEAGAAVFTERFPASPRCPGRRWPVLGQHPLLALGGDDHLFGFCGAVWLLMQRVPGSFSPRVRSGTADLLCFYSLAIVVDFQLLSMR